MGNRIRSNLFKGIGLEDIQRYTLTSECHWINLTITWIESRKPCFWLRLVLLHACPDMRSGAGMALQGLTNYTSLYIFSEGDSAYSLPPQLFAPPILLTIPQINLFPTLQSGVVRISAKSTHSLTTHLTTSLTHPCQIMPVNVKSK